MAPTESGVLQLLSWTLLWKFCVQSFITGYFKLKDMVWDKLPLLSDQNCSIQKNYYFFQRLDCKTVGFFSKSVKKSVKCGVRVLRTRASFSVFSLIPDLLFDCSHVLEYAKIRPVLQSIQRSLKMLMSFSKRALHDDVL